MTSIATRGMYILCTLQPVAMIGRWCYIESIRNKKTNMKILKTFIYMAIFLAFLLLADKLIDISKKAHCHRELLQSQQFPDWTAQGWLYEQCDHHGIILPR